MPVVVTTTPQQKRILWDHLLQNRIEQVAFVFATLSRKDQGVIFRAASMYLATPEDFEYQSCYHVTLNDTARAKIIKRAWDTNTALIEFHSHPKERRLACFSASDLAGLAEFVPHCWWRLKNRPYAAILVTAKTFDALAWVVDPRTPVALDALDVDGGQSLVPTNRTIVMLRCKGTTYGH